MLQGAKYLMGGGELSDQEATEWLLKAAYHAQSMLHSSFPDANPREGVKLLSEEQNKVVNGFIQAAEEGDTTALLILLRISMRGWDVKNAFNKDVVQSCRQAAAENNAQAQCNLGAMYDMGEGVKKDQKEAVRWFRGAANQGHPLAQFSLGLRYAQGRGVEKDQKEGVRWLKKAAAQNDALAQFQLGFMYSKGYGVDQNDEEALKWLLMASENQREISSKYLIERYFRLVSSPILNLTPTASPAHSAMEILQEAEHYLGLHMGAVRAYNGLHFKEHLNDSFDENFFPEALEDARSCIECVTAFDNPGFLLTCIDPIVPSHKTATVLCPLQIDASFYFCVGEKNVKFGTQLRGLLHKIKDHIGLKGCIDHFESVQKIAPEHYAGKGGEMLIDLKRIKGNLNCLTTQNVHKNQGASLGTESEFHKVVSLRISGRILFNGVSEISLFQS